MSTPSTPRKALAGAVAAVSLGVGGLAVAALNPIGTASAEDPEGSTTTTTAPGATTPESTPDGGDHGGRGEWRDRLREWRAGGGALQEVLDGLVADGTLTQEQADAVTDGVEAKVGEWREEHGGERGPGVLRGLWDEAAAVIGVEPDALRDGLQEGSSLAEIAAEAGVERQALIDALVAKGGELVDVAVASGAIDEERAAEIKADLPDHVADLVDATPPGHR